jgi:hypothetical protein
MTLVHWWNVAVTVAFCFSWRHVRRENQRLLQRLEAAEDRRVKSAALVESYGKSLDLLITRFSKTERERQHLESQIKAFKRDFRRRLAQDLAK